MGLVLNKQIKSNLNIGNISYNDLVYIKNAQGSSKKAIKSLSLLSFYLNQGKIELNGYSPLIGQKSFNLIQGSDEFSELKSRLAKANHSVLLALQEKCFFKGNKDVVALAENSFPLFDESQKESILQILAGQITEKNRLIAQNILTRLHTKSDEKFSEKINLILNEIKSNKTLKHKNKAFLVKLGTSLALGTTSTYLYSQSEFAQFVGGFSDSNLIGLTLLFSTTTYLFLFMASINESIQKCFNKTREFFKNLYNNLQFTLKNEKISNSILPMMRNLSLIDSIFFSKIKEEFYLENMHPNSEKLSSIENFDLAHNIACHKFSIADSNYDIYVRTWYEIKTILNSNGSISSAKLHLERAFDRIKINKDKLELLIENSELKYKNKLPAQNATSCETYLETLKSMSNSLFEEKYRLDSLMFLQEMLGSPKANAKKITRFMDSFASYI